MTVLEVTGLVVRRGRTTVVSDVDLAVEQGEVVAVLGPNGAGKSSFLEAVGGVLSPYNGTVRVDGRVATVMQSPGLARRSVRANVELALAWWGVPRRQRRGRAMEALEQMRAAHLAPRPSASLSGGERRRVHVARGIALRPDLLLLDEPFAGLDPESRAGLTEDTASALRASARAVVVVVHERAEAWALADRLVVMMAGRVAAQGRPRELLADPPSAEVARFLGYDGELRRGDRLLLTRPAHVQLLPADDPAAELSAVVTRVVPRQDGALLELSTDHGTLRALADEASRETPGDPVGVRLIGGAGFPRTPEP